MYALLVNITGMDALGNYFISASRFYIGGSLRHAMYIRAVLPRIVSSRFRSVLLAPATR